MNKTPWMNNTTLDKIHGSTRSTPPNQKPGSTQKLVLLAALIVLFTAHSCRPGRELLPTTPAAMAPSQAIASMHSAQPVYDFFTARFSGTATLDGGPYSVAGTIRIRKDSAIYISVAPILGIEVARLVVTPDTVKFLNRLESTYFEGETRFLGALVNADIDFYMMQSLLTGTDLSNFSADNFRVSTDRNMLLLNSPDRRRLRTPTGGTTSTTGRTSRTTGGTPAATGGTARTTGGTPTTTGGTPEATGGISLEHNLWLDKESFRIMQASLHDKATQTSIQVRYPSHTSAAGQMFPSELRMVVVDPSNRAELDISITRVTINQPQQITFSVPPGYVPMRF
jgi:hypothetical protein